MKMKKIVVVLAFWLLVSTMLTAGCFEDNIPVDMAHDLPTFNSVSWNRVSVANKATFVGFDPESYLDDYCYLSAVPASVFYDLPSETIMSHPLLFYNDPMEASSKELRTYNDHQGLDYFMQDFNAVAGNLDMVDYVNMDASQVSVAQSQWGGNKSHVINSADPYQAAAEIALHNWEYSSSAVLVPMDPSPDFQKVTFSGKVNGSTPPKPVETMSIEGTKEPNPIIPNNHDFEINEGYKYINAYMTWGADWEPETLKKLIERGKDPDMQLFDNQLCQVAASENWNILTGPSEEINSYVYHSGDWRVAVTYMPTEEVLSLDEDITALRESLRGLQAPPAGYGYDEPPASNSEALYTIDLTLYPGVDVPIMDTVPFSARNIEVTLTSPGGCGDLGIVLNGPSGAEIAADISDSESKQLTISELGIGAHSVAVVNLVDDSRAKDFEVSYSWDQTQSLTTGLSLASSAQGAVLGSMLNAPLLYTRMGSVPAQTQKVLDALGVTDVHLINIDDYASASLKDSIEDVRSLFQSSLDVVEYNDVGKIYARIKDLSSVNSTWGNDVVFSTINPWDPWVGGSTEPEPEVEKALYIGPGAYAAAHHGTPLIIPDISPEISSAQAWHNNYWKEAYAGRGAPSVACMILTGRRVYDYLDEHDLDLPNDQESILTVAGQFDIGTAWDRMFTMVAYPGRIMGTPVDTSYWVSRSVFYPYVIFANPGVNLELSGGTPSYITGSSSTRVAGTLQITQPEREVELEYPILESWVSYQHKFNELAAEYWGCPYTTRTGITPYYTQSPDPLDAGLGGNYPDITTSEIVSYYSKKGNFGEAFTTNFETTMENLNRGVIMWYEVMHGGSRDGGIVGFWNTQQKESNPWRGYEENGIPLVSVGGDGIIGSNPLADLTKMRGSTEDPDVVTMSKYYGLDLQPSTGPRTDNGIIPETHDGVIIAILQQGQTGLQDGYMFDDSLDNIHSAGVSAGSCLIANTYLHLTMMRHGSVFQIIDPWLTSWYSSFAMEMFAKDQIEGGYTVGQSYVRGINHVGIQYLLVDGGWWDIFENLVYFGDPDLVMFTPNDAWEKPIAMKPGTSVNGHNFYGVQDHPFEIDSITTGWIIGLFILVAGMIGAGLYVFRNKGKHKGGQKL